MNDLLPCPFCGAAPVMDHKGNDFTKRRSVTVRCPNCRVQRTDAAMRNSIAWLEEVAIEQWNQRVEPALGGLLLAGHAPALEVA